MTTDRGEQHQEQDAEDNENRGHAPDLEALARKCSHLATEHSIEYDRTPPEFWFLLDQEVYGVYSRFYIKSGPLAQLALDTPFESYRKPSDGYEAIWSPDFRAVECEVAPCESYGDWDEVSSRAKDRFTRTILSKLGIRTDTAGKMWEIADPDEFDDLDAFNQEMHSRVLAYREKIAKDLDDVELDPASGMFLEAGGGVTVSVRVCSDAWVVWHTAQDSAEYEPDRAAHYRCLTLRVEGIEVSDEIEAASILERLGNAALFELDRATGIGLTLCRQRSDTKLTRRVFSTGSPLPSQITSEYDKEPLTLYWHARTVSEMPLLAFLGFYQVLEFYFPQYSRHGALRTLRESLRGLSFDALRDADLAKVLDAVKVGRKGSFGNEVEQLKATVKHCVDQNTLREFFEENDEHKQFYGSDECMRLSPTRIPISGSSEDWRGDVARRLYDIRNRVVHAKSQHEDLDVLLPTDPEAELLWHDVELAAFLAGEVLSASGKPLRNETVGP